MHNPRVHLTTDVHLKAGCRRIICIEPIEAMKKAPTDAGGVDVDQQEEKAVFQHASNLFEKNLASSISVVDDSTTKQNRSHPAFQRANVFQHLPHPEFSQCHHVVLNQPHVRICHFRFIQNSLPHITLSIVFMTLLHEYYFRQESRERVSIDVPHAYATQATGQDFYNLFLASSNDNYYRPLITLYVRTGRQVHKSSFKQFKIN